MRKLLVVLTNWLVFTLQGALLKLLYKNCLTVLCPFVIIRWWKCNARDSAVSHKNKTLVARGGHFFLSFYVQILSNSRSYFVLALAKQKKCSGRFLLLKTTCAMLLPPPVQDKDRENQCCLSLVH